MINKRYGEWYNIQDFIRPDDFMVGEALASIADQTPLGILNWTIENFIYPEGNLLDADQHTQIAYQGSTRIVLTQPDFWSFPAEILRDGIGDCEDRVHLLASMLRATGWRSDQVFATVGLYGNAGHAWVMIAQPGGPIVLETTLDRPTQDLMSEIAPYRPFFRYNDERVVVVERVEIPEIQLRGGRGGN